jgi:hypothetical protein
VNEKPPESKLCTRCLKVKPMGEFEDAPGMRWDKKSYCRPCSAELRGQWTEGDPLV